MQKFKSIKTVVCCIEILKKVFNIIKWLTIQLFVNELTNTTTYATKPVLIKWNRQLKWASRIRGISHRQMERHSEIPIIFNIAIQITCLINCLIVIIWIMIFVLRAQIKIVIIRTFKIILSRYVRDRMFHLDLNSSLCINKFVCKIINREIVSLDRMYIRPMIRIKLTSYLSIVDPLQTTLWDKTDFKSMILIKWITRQV